MKTLFTYLLIAIFSVGTLQASVGACVHMGMQDMQQEAPVDMSNDQMPCHSMANDVAAEEESNNSCCDGGCDSCVSVSATFNSQTNTFEQDYADRYTQTVVLAYPSNHVKIPTPPPNS